MIRVDKIYLEAKLSRVSKANKKEKEKNFVHDFEIDRLMKDTRTKNKRNRERLNKSVITSKV